MIRKIFDPNKLSSLKITFKTTLRLLGLFWQIDKTLFIALSITFLLPAIFPFVSAYIFKLVIDEIVRSLSAGSANINYLLILLFSFFVSSTLQNIVFSIQDYVNRLMFTKVPIALYQIFLNKISTLDLEYFENSDFREIMEKVRDAYAWRPLGMLSNVFYALQAIFGVIISLAILATLNIYFVIIILVVAIPEFLLKGQQSRLGWNLWDDHSPERVKFWYLSELLQKRENIKELKIFQLSGRFLSELKAIHTKFYVRNKKLADSFLGVNTVYNFASGFVSVSILGYIVLQAIAKKISVGDISYYTTSISNFQQNLSGFFMSIVRVFEQSLYVSSLFEVLDFDSKIKINKKAVAVDYKKPPRIEFRNVTFSYPNQEMKVFDNFNLIIEPGEKIALVGENGAGKTTLMKLLARFYDVTGGDILINDTNIKDIDLNSWYKALGILFQDFVQYQYPARDNIHFGRVWEKDELSEIMKAAKLGGADSVINKFEKKYDQMLGTEFKEGVDLSGGQWQKVALSRAFFRNAPVLVLDEPTASIDAKAESEIFNRVERLSKDKTVIIISHRFSTVRNADKIYVIENGKIVESGSHQQLMKQDGQYAALFKLQAKGYQ